MSLEEIRIDLDGFFQMLHGSVEIAGQKGFLCTLVALHGFRRNAQLSDGDGIAGRRGAIGVDIEVAVCSRKRIGEIGGVNCVAGCTGSGMAPRLRSKSGSQGKQENNSKDRFHVDTPSGEPVRRARAVRVRGQLGTLSEPCRA
jgi:hypothetical protein